MTQTADESWRRRADSNRRITDLQSAALPLGYGAVFIRARAFSHTCAPASTAALGVESRSAGCVREPLRPTWDRGRVRPGSNAVPTLTVPRSLLALLGLTVATLQAPVLTPQAARVLRPLLRQQGFDLERPIRVREMEHEQGFHLEQ
jgi:hypothetical protein